MVSEGDVQMYKTNVRVMQPYICRLQMERNMLIELCERCKANIAQNSLPVELQSAIRAALSTAFGEQFEVKQFAVRSSACGEDSDEMSAAGQMTTFLGVRGLEDIYKSG